MGASCLAEATRDGAQGRTTERRFESRSPHCRASPRRAAPPAASPRGPPALDGWPQRRTPRASSGAAAALPASPPLSGDAAKTAACPARAAG
eukprot:4191115-Prymnesium_polylepis.1